MQVGIIIDNEYVSLYKMAMKYFSLIDMNMIMLILFWFLSSHMSDLLYDRVQSTEYKKKYFCLIISFWSVSQNSSDSLQNMDLIASMTITCSS